MNVTLSFHARRIYYDSEKEVLLLFCTCHIHLYDRADSGISVVFFTDTWYIGAFYAREKYGVEDDDILSAIEFHTTGRPAMSLLEKIVFVADYIEPNRRALPEIEQIRREAFTDIDVSVVHILRNTLSYLSNENCGSTDEMSVMTYNYYVSQTDENKAK